MQIVNYITKWSQLSEATKDSLLQRVEKLRLPPNPLDELIHLLGGTLSSDSVADVLSDCTLPFDSESVACDAGTKRVAEMTGRSSRLELVNGRWRRARRVNDSCTDALNISEKKQFMAGKKLVAVISDAASTGISLQADRRVVNQRQRVHITVILTLHRRSAWLSPHLA